MVSHSIRGEKVQIYRRENSRFWQCSTFLNGKNYRVSTKQESLAKAKEVAEDWYTQNPREFRKRDLQPGLILIRSGYEQGLSEFGGSRLFPNDDAASNQQRRASSDEHIAAA